MEEGAVNHEAMAGALLPVREFLATPWRRHHQALMANGARDMFGKKRALLPVVLSGGMCRHSTLFLRTLLREAGDASWKARGGWMLNKEARGEPDQEPFSSQDLGVRLDVERRFWQRHWWMSDGRTIMDLTADQFWWDDVTVCEAGDPRYEVVPELCGSRYLSSLKKTVQQWAGPGAPLATQRYDEECVGMARAYVKLREDFVQAWPDVVAAREEDFSPRPF